MLVHFADRLLHAIQSKGAPICIGIDPVLDRLPASILGEFELDSQAALRDAGTLATKVANAFVAYGRGVLTAIAPIAPIVKINIAFFERYWADGVRAYHELVRIAHQQGLLVIGDIKRADIGHTSAAYAEGSLGTPGDSSDSTIPDAVTINPYFGSDGVSPFIELARRNGRGVFVLVQTSNESASEIQDLRLADGATVSERIALLVQNWSSKDGLIGECGYSCVGAVVSPRDIESTERLRRLMPHSIFLVPGFGAQGRSAEEVAKCFTPGATGAIVNASRSVGFAYTDKRYSNDHGHDWSRCVEEACGQFKRDVCEAIGRI